MSQSKGTIGVQMMMLKEKIASEGAYAVFGKLKEIGYSCVEISQIPMTKENVDEMRRGIKDFGVRVCASSASIDPMRPGMPGDFLSTGFDKIVDDCRALDCSLLRIGMMPFTSLGGKDKALEFAKRADEMARRLSEQGISLYYHNHHVEFTRFDGKYMLDILRDETTKLGFELDVHWIHFGGENPVTYIPKFKGRIRLLHLKDYRIGAFQMPENPTGPQSFMAAFKNVVQFAEVGEGNLPMKQIIETGLANGSEYFIIEQDDLYGRDVYDSLITSRDNLRGMGYADWF